MSRAPHSQAQLKCCRPERGAPRSLRPAICAVWLRTRRARRPAFFPAPTTARQGRRRTRPTESRPRRGVDRRLSRLRRRAANATGTHRRTTDPLPKRASRRRPLHPSPTLRRRRARRPRACAPRTRRRSAAPPPAGRLRRAPRRDRVPWPARCRSARAAATTRVQFVPPRRARCARGRFAQHRRDGLRARDPRR